jgi:hypothetical protein
VKKLNKNMLINKRFLFVKMNIKNKIKIKLIKNFDHQNRFVDVFTWKLDSELSSELWYERLAMVE